MSAIKAELRQYKPLVSRPYMQIILEVPAEQATAAMSALGYPMPGHSIWLGIARLDNEIVEQNQAAAASELEGA